MKNDLKEYGQGGINAQGATSNLRSLLCKTHLLLPFVLCQGKTSIGIINSISIDVLVDLQSREFDVRAKLFQIL